MAKQKGIYVITDTTAGKVYIGSSEDLRSRFNQHANDLKRNDHGNIYLQKAHKAGHKATVTAIPVSDDVDVRKVEQTLLDEFIDSGILYNICRDAIAPRAGLKDSPETIEKLKAIAVEQGRRPSPEALAASTVANASRIRPPEEIEAARARQIERMKDPENRRISASMLGKHHSPETVAKIRAKVFEDGRGISQQCREACIKAHVGRKHSEEEIAKRVAATTGLKRSGEALENIKAGALKRVEASKRPVIIDGNKYESPMDAVSALGIPKTTLYKRLRSDKEEHGAWHYV